MLLELILGNITADILYDISTDDLFFNRKVLEFLISSSLHPETQKFMK
jgi:hypothetical protein